MRLGAAAAAAALLAACSGSDDPGPLVCDPGYVACLGACHDASVRAEPGLPDAFEPNGASAAALPADACAVALTLPTNDLDAFSIFADGRPLTVTAYSQTSGFQLLLQLRSASERLLGEASGDSPTATVATAPGYTFVIVQRDPSSPLSQGEYFLVWDFR